MKYSKWTLGNGTIFVEKYVGKISKEAVLKNDDELLNNAGSDAGPVFIISDLSQASWEDIGFGDLLDLFQPIEQNSTNVDMKIALFCGENSIEDYIKASAYSKYDNKFNINVRVFSSIEEIGNWFRLKEEELAQVKTVLNIS